MKMRKRGGKGEKRRVNDTKNLPSRFCRAYSLSRVLFQAPKEKREKTKTPRHRGKVTEKGGEMGKCTSVG